MVLDTLKTHTTNKTPHFSLFLWLSRYWDKKFMVAVFVVVHEVSFKYCVCLVKRQLEASLTPQCVLCLSLERDGEIADSPRGAVHLEVNK